MRRRAQRRLARELARRCQRLVEEVGAAEAERRVFREAIYGTHEIDPDDCETLYQDFLDAFEPGRRRAAGVYYTPPALARAQVRLVDDVLRTRLGYQDGLADERALIVDPCAGSGAYPLAIIDQVGTTEVTRRLRCFEPAPGAATLCGAKGLPVEQRDVLEQPVAFDAPAVICLGNPPYRRQPAHAAARILLDGLTEHTPGVHLKNLYNDYVYFWAWALRSVFEQRAGAGVVCFVTGASYLRGAAFGGLRRRLRRLVDELWVIDLEGDPLAARKTHNVFPIRTPVAVALGVRGASPNRAAIAKVSYTRLAGSCEQKIAALERLRHLDDLAWRPASPDRFTPNTTARYERWPALTELFPWQLCGVQMKRTWPIGATPDVLRERWRQLLQLPPDQRATSFGPTRDRDLDSTPPDLRESDTRLTPLRELPPDAACLEPVRYAYRSFDRQWLLPDARLGDFMRPTLWRVAGRRHAGRRQLFLTSMLTNVLGPGPAVVATSLVPDLDHFRGSFGARAVIPLWCDAAVARPNIDGAWLARLSGDYGFAVSPELLMAYCYALLATRRYVARFAEELRVPGPRVPITPGPGLFLEAASRGETLLAIHTYRQVTPGAARCLAPVGGAYPADFAYQADRGTLRVGDGLFGPVTSAVWGYGVSGLQVVRSWLRRRMPRTGRSPLSAIHPEAWTPQLTTELLELLWLLEATLALEPSLDALLDEIVSGSVYDATAEAGGEQAQDGVRPQRSGEDVALTLVTPELLELSPL